MSLHYRVILFVSFILISSNLHAGVVRKIKGQKVLITIQGHEGVRKGETIQIRNSSGKMVKTVVRKVGKKSVLVLAPKNSGLKVGDKTSSSGNSVAKKSKPKKNQRVKKRKKKSGKKNQGWFIEPFAGKVTGSFESNLEYTAVLFGTGVIEGSISAFEIGTTGGYSMNSFLLGGKFSYQIGALLDTKLKTQLTAGSAETEQGDSDYSKNGFGPYVGYEITRSIRVWASYLLTGMKATSTSGTGTVYAGTTIEAGAGWKLENNISLNLNYGMTSYSEEDGKAYPYSETGSSNTVTQTKDAKETYFVLGISYYWSFFD